MKDIILEILVAIQSDDVDTEVESEKLVEYYSSLTDAEKRVVDNVFTYVCGWTIKTLIDN